MAFWIEHSLKITQKDFRLAFTISNATGSHSASNWHLLWYCSSVSFSQAVTFLHLSCVPCMWLRSECVHQCSLLVDAHLGNLNHSRHFAQCSHTHTHTRTHARTHTYMHTQSNLAGFLEFKCRCGANFGFKRKKYLVCALFFGVCLVVHRRKRWPLRRQVSSVAGCVLGMEFPLPCCVQTRREEL